MKTTLGFAIAASLLMITGRCAAQTSAAANCSVTIVSGPDTDMPISSEKRKGEGIAVVTSLRTTGTGVPTQPVIIKGDFIKMSLLGKKRKNPEIRNNSTSY